MSSYTKYPLLKLVQLLAEVDREIEKACPELVEEKRLLERLIRARENPEGPTFTKTKGIVQAIELCFEFAGEMISRTKIEEMLAAGGYPLPVETAKALIRQTLNYHTETGRFANKGELYGPGKKKKISSK